MLPRGGVIDLPMPSRAPAPEWYITAGRAPRSDCEIDVVAFVLDEDEQVTFDEDFIFYGAPESPAGTVRLLTGGPAEQSVALDLAALPPAARGPQGRRRRGHRRPGHLRNGRRDPDRRGSRHQRIAPRPGHP
ncbi:hypothetical protein OK074_1696 [Actinobacteria bacterium OK074]|nr:hypothetical protein OK074_1696 [Actinobacteria bacterium OK074]